jgi:hypothetical protein
MIPIYFNELAEVLRVCTRLRPDECSPIHIQNLMASQLASRDRGLAEKILAFDGPQLLALSAFIIQAQVLVGMTARLSNSGSANGHSEE